MREHDSSSPAASEADLADQATPVVHDDDEAIPADDLAALGEADPADAMDQRRAVPLDEDR